MSYVGFLDTLCLQALDYRAPGAKGAEDPVLGKLVSVVLNVVWVLFLLRSLLPILANPLIQVWMINHQVARAKPGKF